MTIPYIPGFGDTLKETLPQLAEATKRIINPYYDKEQAFTAHITQHPEDIPALAEIETNSPGSLTKIFGPNTGKFLSTLNLSPAQQLNRKVNEAATQVTEQNPQAVGEKALGVDLQQRESQGMDLEAKRNLINSLKQSKIPPEMQALIIKNGGISEQDLRDISMSNIADEAVKTKSPKEIMDAFLAGTPLKMGTTEYPIADVMQGLFTSRAESTKAMFAKMMQDADNEGRIKIANIAHLNGRRDLMQQLYLDFSRNMSAKHPEINVPAAFALQYGDNALQDIQGLYAKDAITPESVAATKKQLDNLSTYASLKSNAPIAAAFDALGKAKGSAKAAAATNLNTLLGQAGYNNIAATVDGKIKIIDANGNQQEVDPRSFWDKFVKDSPIAPTMQQDSTSSPADALISDFKAGKGTAQQLITSQKYKSLSQEDQLKVMRAISSGAK
jgi:hypothetical protein